MPTRHTHTRSRSGWAVTLTAIALTGVLCTAALAAVRGDDGRLPWTGTATAATVAPDQHPGEAAKQSAARARARPAEPTDSLSWPLRGAVSGSFGEPRGGHMHAGVDIPIAAGTPIKAAGDGEVVMREVQDGYGNYTCIAHRTITTCYAHQSRFSTSVGARVKRGEVIGYVGNTGNSGAVHLHFEVRRGTRPWGTPVDPAKHLPRG